MQGVLVPKPPPISAASAYWKYRQSISQNHALLQWLIAAVGASHSLSPSQWAQTIAMTLEFRPDNVLELGRGNGNSTCAFFTAMQRRPHALPTIRLCRSTEWFMKTAARVTPIIDAKSLSTADTYITEVTSVDFAKNLSR